MIGELRELRRQVTEARELDDLSLSLGGNIGGGVELSGFVSVSVSMELFSLYKRERYDISNFLLAFPAPGPQEFCATGRAYLMILIHLVDIFFSLLIYL